MAFRTWGRLLLTALGVSVLAGAGQLGVAYGFGIVRLTGAFTGTTVNQWPAQLVWVGWFAANAAVAGAVLTGRLARRDTPAAGTGRQLAVGGAAALGATVIAPLCMQPARAAELISVDPVWAVGICAMVGAVIGAGAAIAVLFRPELGWNVAAVAGAVWLLALISVLPSLGTVGPLPTVRLGVLEPSWLDDAAAQRLALLLLPIVALLAGAATAGLARWRGQAPLVSGATGVAGPVLVAFAYLTAGPGDAVDRYQAAPYYGSLIAILAGALGAAAAALLRWPTGTRATDPQAIEPTAILRPLPAGPALPGAANDRDSTERTDTETTNADLATAQPGGVVAGPWAAGDPDSVRTVPAHWDWPETTASGQHGPAPATASPAAPTQPAAWLTAPTGEFSAAGQTLPRHDDVPATTEPSASTDVSRVTDASATGTTAGRVDAATPTGGRAADELTGSTATGTSGSTATGTSGSTATSGGPTDGRTTRKPAATPSSAAAPGSGATSAAATSALTSSDAPVPATGSTARTSAAATRAARTSAAPTSTGSGSEATSTVPTGTDAPRPAATGTSSKGTSSTSTEATSAGTAGQDTPGAAPTIKPRRSRKPKANPEATASDATDDTSPAGSATTSETPTSETTTDATPARETTTDATPARVTTADATPARETTAGRATKGTRPGRSADSTGSDAATDTPSSSRGSVGERSSSTSDVSSAAASGTAAAAPATAAGAKRAPATPVTGSKRTPAASTTAATGATEVPASPEPSTTATDATQTSTTATPAPTTAAGATPAAAAPTTAAGQVGAEATARVPKAGTGSRAAPADAASDSAIAGARGTDSGRPAAEDVPTAGLFGATAASDPDADRWTPAPSAWPVTPTWTVPPQASEPEATTSEGSSNPDEPTGPMPRPRHRAPLPDLSRAGTWNAFDTSRRRGSAGSQDSSTARTAPADASETTTPAEHPAPTEFPGTLGAPAGSATTTSATADSAATTSATGTGAGDLTPADAASATPTTPKVAEQPSRRGRLGGLFRRNRSRADEESPKTSDAAEPLATQDEEFVDWVAGLGKPVSDNEPEQENGRRSLRSTGRHHRD
ncbi:hypothetical protein NIE79_002491 [Micromonospora sp. NIE79]|uniref:MFS transporter n=1 Tax=Micromonospora trifolii TaxID=2911208 RepID=A0ABS9N3P3_9ACTN|nr:hypothetical protein [Micromonospora trifolii]MCG5444343.1 hypothetical protein [Micromonospora trifolii]